MEDIVLTIINVETSDHIPLSQLGCYISLDNMFVDLITPIMPSYNEHNVLRITPDTASEEVSFIVKVMGSIENSVGSTRVPAARFRMPTEDVDSQGYC